ncbi:lectin 6-like [Prosopis cineraria]|uniref:lectin 6-like n=1 Tax=Prosopis cineraria TaxID=364024 RepID=UPI00240EC44B|nr:lectin 6-like [Prosopis cineraria]
MPAIRWKPEPSLILIFLFFLLLLHKINSESISFSFKVFESQPDLLPIALAGDAISYGGAMLLTKRDFKRGANLTMRQHSVGRAVYLTPIHLWNSDTGKVADFTTEFSFVVASDGSILHGDGLAFFIAPVETALHIPANSSGGYLGLFGPEIAFSTSRNEIVAVELDSFGNEWDPIPEPLAAHVGIDVNSLRSLKTADWPINLVPRGSIGKARITYDARTTTLSVLISYTDTQPNRFVSLSQTIDLTTVLPEWVRIGFSAATGDLVEAHDIVSWSFSSFLPEESD